MKHLLRFGGFPQPVLSGEERAWRRWNRERLDRVVHQDIRDLENVRDLGLIELLAEELPNRVGSPLSVGNLKNLFRRHHRPRPGPQDPEASGENGQTSSGSGYSEGT